MRAQVTVHEILQSARCQKKPQASWLMQPAGAMGLVASRTAQHEYSRHTLQAAAGIQNSMHGVNAFTNWTSAVKWGTSVHALGLETVDCFCCRAEFGDLSFV